MQPTSSSVHIDTFLTQVSQAYRPQMLIADKILPVITVKKQTNKIAIYGKENLRTIDDNYTPGKRAHLFDWTVTSQDAYVTADYGLEGEIVWNDRDNADEPIRYEADTTENVTDSMLVQYEQRVATKLLTASNYSTSHVVNATANWADEKNSDPVYDIDTIRELIWNDSTMDANTLIITRKVRNILRRHKVLLEYYKYTKGGKLTDEILAEIFGVERLLVAGGSSYATKEGQTTDSWSTIWNDAKVILAYIAPKPGIRQVSFGYTYRREGYPFVQRWPEEPVEADYIKVRDQYDTKIQAKDCGVIMTIAGL